MSAEVIIGKIVSLAFSAIDRAQGNSAEGQKLKADLERLSMEARAKLREAQRDIIVAEAKGESWLQRNWRPMTMLFFTGLIGAYWMGFAAPNLPVEAINGLFDVVYIGLGGYVIGRSAEKIVRTAVPAVGQFMGGRGNPPGAVCKIPILHSSPNIFGGRRALCV
jgi:hypothetical protein